jgi:hypothetical protein
LRKFVQAIPRERWRIGRETGSKWAQQRRLREYLTLPERLEYMPPLIFEAAGLFSPVNARLLIAAAAVLGSVAFAAGPIPSRLNYIVPEKWQRSVDANTQVIALIPPGGGATVIFAPSTEFAGTVEAWQQETWNKITASLTPARPFQPGEQGKFLMRTGVFRQPDGSLPWMCLYTLVQDGRGEAVMFITDTDKQLFAHLGTVNQMIHRMTIASTAPADSRAAAKPNVPAAPSVPAPTTSVQNPPSAPGGGVDGLYLATTRQLRFNALGGSGSTSWEVATEFYLLSRDGRVFRGRDLPQAPNGDIGRFDYEAARREAPGNYGTYSVRGDEVALRLGDAPVETIAAKRVGPDALEIRGTAFKRGVREKP